MENSKSEIINNSKEPEIQNSPINNNNSEYIKGIKYFYGLDSRIDYRKAYEIFSKIYKESKSPNNEILVLLGIMHEKGLHVQKFLRKAIEFYKMAAKKDSAKAYYLLAQLAENKILDEEDSSKAFDDVAFDYYKKSASLGFSDAFAKIGVILEQGLLNTKIDLSNAFDNFKKSVEIDNNPVGLNGLGNAYYNGIIKQQNFELAVSYYKDAIREGNIDALNNLGICYEYGKGVDKNIDKALEYYFRAKEKNHGDGTANYAILKIKISLNNNNHSCFSECFKILQSAIILNRNNAEIYFYIGLIYEIGIDLFEDGNIIKNSYLAFLNYKKSAELGYPKAFTKMGISMFNGIEGVFFHNVKASISLLEKAVEKGDNEAKKYLDFIKSHNKK